MARLGLFFRLIGIGGLMLMTACRHGTAGTVVLFPDAARIEVYATSTQSAILVNKAGKVTATGASADGRDIVVPASDGGPLTPGEAARLMSVVHYGNPPDMVAACFIPHHAFTFHDRHGRYLGYLSVCFDCGGAEIRPDQSPTKKMDWVEWDPRVLKAIIEAHHLKVVIP